MLKDWNCRLLLYLFQRICSKLVKEKDVAKILELQPFSLPQKTHLKHYALIDYALPAPCIYAVQGAVITLYD